MVNFSDDIDPTTLTASDLTLSRSGLSSRNPAKATGLTWVDSHTVKFLLTGGFNPTGSVNLSIPAGAVKDTAGDSIAAYAEVVPTRVDHRDDPLHRATTTAAPAVAAAATTVALPIQPVAVAGPIAVHYTTHKLVSKTHSAKAHAAATAKSPKRTKLPRPAQQARTLPPPRLTPSTARRPSKSAERPSDRVILA